MKTISTNLAPGAVGPYSQAIDTGSTVFCSGQIPLVPETMQLVEGDIQAQTRQVFANITQVLDAAGLRLDHVVKTTVFMTDLGQFKAMNAVYEECMGGHKPARSAVEVAGLPLGARIEIECIACR